MHVKISDKPKMKDLIDDFGENVSMIMVGGDIYLEIEEPVGRKLKFKDDVEQKLMTRFKDKHIEELPDYKPRKYSDPRQRPPRRIHPNSRKNTPENVKEREKTLAFAVKHYGQSLSYALHRQGKREASSGLEGKTRRVRQVEKLLEQANIELLALRDQTSDP